MNVEPYSDDEIADARTHLSCDDESERCHYHDVAHWLATVDALKARLAAAEAERDDLRRYRKSWDKELRDAKEAARAAIDGRIAAEAEAERARGALVEVRRMIESDAYRASITARIDAHLASRPEGEVRDGR